jgi:hypothetical protein
MPHAATKRHDGDLELFLRGIRSAGFGKAETAASADVWWKKVRRFMVVKQIAFDPACLAASNVISRAQRRGIAKLRFLRQQSIRP